MNARQPARIRNTKNSSRNNLRKLNYHIKELSSETGILPGSWISSMNYSGFNDFTGDQAKMFLDSLATALRTKNRIISDRKDSLVKSITDRMGEAEFQTLKEANYNESLANFVLNRLNTNKIFESEKKLIQKADPVYMKPGSKYGRAHFYAPYKKIGNVRIDTLLFNVIAIWIMTIAIIRYFVSECSLSVSLNSLKPLRSRSGENSEGNCCRSEIEHLIPQPLLLKREGEKRNR